MVSTEEKEERSRGGASKPVWHSVYGAYTDDTYTEATGIIGTALNRQTRRRRRHSWARHKSRQNK
jgi:hypothetical protein